MKKIGGYEIKGQIGSGGMSTVYSGRQVSLDRPVAIKVLSEKLSDSQEVLRRFERESMIIARLHHPGIIHVIDRGVHKGLPYFVMEYVEGKDLAQVIRAGTLDTKHKLDIVIQICKALSYAHRNGVVHRDIKPANVIVDGDGRARMLDFGIAKLFEDGMVDRQATQANLVLGTLAYMSPEQQSGSADVTAASDLYSLGVMMYELFTGNKPIGRFPSPSEADPTVPEALDHVINRCLQSEPHHRFPTAEAVKDHLLAVLEGTHLQTDVKERSRVDLAAVASKFTLLDVLRQDSHGNTYLYMDNRDRRLLVIKRRLGAPEGFAEAKRMIGLEHENLAAVIGVSGDRDRYIVVTEYISGGSLDDRLVNPFPAQEALRFAGDILRGVSFAHQHGIVHGALRPSGILLGPSGTVKVADFGFSKHRDSKMPDPYNVWQLPKSPQADLLALGTILHEMICCSLPAWRIDELVPGELFETQHGDVQQLVRRLLSPHAETRYGGYEPVIQEIDRLLYELEADESDPEQTRIMSPQRGANRWSFGDGRLVRSLPVIVMSVLLIVVAYLYLVGTGQDRFWTDLFRGVWDRI